MKQTGFLVTLALGLLAAPLAAEAQAAKPARIGVLGVAKTIQFEGFREGMRELGHIEGQTYTLDERYSGGKAERYPELAADLARSRVDLVIAVGGAAARAVREANAAIPVVFFSTNPIAEGLVASWNRPGGNLTGFALPWEDLNSKWAELLRDAFPRIRRVAYLFFSPFPLQLERFEAAAAVLRLEVLPLPVRAEADIEAAFAAAAQWRAEAIA